MLRTGASGCIWEMSDKGEFHMETIAWNHARNALSLLLALTILPVSVSAGESYSPHVDQSYPTNVYWGDTHVHTALSGDAFGTGTRLMPGDAYRFAKGEELVSSTGQRVKLSRPLDFLVVADHSDNMGFFPRLHAGEADILAHPKGREWYGMIQKGGQEAVKAAADIIGSFTQGTFPNELMSLPGTGPFRSTWDEIIKAADEANAPGEFSAFIGYEWTSTTKGNNLHRVLIYRDGGQRAGLIEPYTTAKPYGSDNPEDLWKWMAVLFS